MEDMEKENGNGEELLELTRVITAELTLVSYITERQYAEGALMEREAFQIAKKQLPKEWNVDDVTLVRMQDFMREVPHGTQENGTTDETKNGSGIEEERIC